MRALGSVDNERPIVDEEAQRAAIAVEKNADHIASRYAALTTAVMLAAYNVQIFASCGNSK